MGLVGFECPPYAATAGEHHTIDHCVSGCAAPCTAPPLLTAILESSNSNYHQGNYLSASLLTGGCARQTVYERTLPFYAQPKTRYWSFRGTHAHSLIEGASERLLPFGILSELRLQVPITYADMPAPVFEDGKWTGDFDSTQPLIVLLSGTMDCYNVLRRAMYDFKTMDDSKVLRMITGQRDAWLTPPTWSKHIEDSWVVQLNIYAWLLANSPIPDAIRAKLEAHGIVIDSVNFPAPESLHIQAVAPMEIPMSGTTYAPQRHKGEPYAIDNVPLWSLADTEAYIRPRLLDWHRYLILGQLPPVVPASKKWMCTNCPFASSKGGPCEHAKERRLAAAKEAPVVLPWD